MFHPGSPEGQNILLRVAPVKSVRSKADEEGIEMERGLLTWVQSIPPYLRYRTLCVFIDNLESTWYPAAARHLYLTGN